MRRKKETKAQQNFEEARKSMFLHVCKVRHMTKKKQSRWKRTIIFTLDINCTVKDRHFLTGVKLHSEFY